MMIGCKLLESIGLEKLSSVKMELEFRYKKFVEIRDIALRILLFYLMLNGII